MEGSAGWFYEWYICVQEEQEVVTLPGTLWSKEAMSGLVEDPPIAVSGLPFCHFVRWVVYVPV